MPKNMLTTSPGWVSLELFEPIPTSGLTLDDARSLADRVQAIVTAGVAAANARVVSGEDPGIADEPTGEGARVVGAPAGAGG
jgi:hypothetical protein